MVKFTDLQKTNNELTKCHNWFFNTKLAECHIWLVHSITIPGVSQFHYFLVFTNPSHFSMLSNFSNHSLILPDLSKISPISFESSIKRHNYATTFGDNHRGTLCWPPKQFGQEIIIPNLGSLKSSNPWKSPKEVFKGNN